MSRAPAYLYSFLEEIEKIANLIGEGVERGVQIADPIIGRYITGGRKIMPLTSGNPATSGGRELLQQAMETRAANQPGFLRGLWQKLRGQQPQILGPLGTRAQAMNPDQLSDTIMEAGLPAMGNAFGAGGNKQRIMANFLEGSRIDRATWTPPAAQQAMARELQAIQGAVP